MRKIKILLALTLLLMLTVFLVGCRCEPDSLTTRTERTVTDSAEIAEIMNLLHNVSLLRVPSDAFAFDEKVEISVIIKIDRNHTVYLRATDGYIYTAAKYWRVSDWPGIE